LTGFRKEKDTKEEEEEEEEVRKTNRFEQVSRNRTPRMLPFGCIADLLLFLQIVTYSKNVSIIYFSLL
jgi:hypothetical protein